MADLRVGVRIQGDDSDIQDAFDNVGRGARDMAKDIDTSADDASTGFGKLGEGIDNSESKFRGLGDTIGGTGDIMQGFKDGNIVGVAMGFADLAGGITEFVVPALTAMKGAILTGLAPALTAISAHPLIAGILAGGAIIAGLIVLEKKFGVVSGAVGFLKDALGKVLEPLGGIIGGFKDLWNSTIGGKGFSFGGIDLPGPLDVPGFELRIPTLHTGGFVPGVAGQDVLTRLQAGEWVGARGTTDRAQQPLTINVYGSLIHERDLPAVVAAAGRAAPLIGVT